MISVGGVFLAIVILVLALNPPEDSDRRLARVSMPARGPLLDAGDHPEWRQFLIHAAVRRADALEELRWLPDTRVPVVPVLSEPLPPLAAAPGRNLPGAPSGKVAILPEAPHVGDADGFIGSNAAQAQDGGIIPIDIGAASSSELLVAPSEETPPVIRSPKVDGPQESRKPRSRTLRQAKPATEPDARAELNLLEALLSLFKRRTGPADSVKQATAN